MAKWLLIRILDEAADVRVSEVMLEAEQKVSEVKIEQIELRSDFSSAEMLAKHWGALLLESNGLSSKTERYQADPPPEHDDEIGMVSAQRRLDEHMASTLLGWTHCIQFFVVKQCAQLP